MIRACFAALVLCAVLVSAPGAWAQSLFEQLVMPGDLISGHQKLQAECDNCHESFSQGAQSSLCKDCHKEIAADLSARTGFHGKSPEATTQECRHCHTDHIGRDAEIVVLDRETFNHVPTDFTLRGAHLQVACSGCHTEKLRFREAPGKCVDCHRKDEPHQGRLGDSCTDCHNETAWSETSAFNHDETAFRLVGRHRQVPCESCHQREVYKGLPTTCVGCHRIQDVHGGRLGAKCETCHSEEKWQDVRFDHNTDTDFALKGQHAKVACKTCHTGFDPAVKLPVDCFGCHETDDPHKGQLGRSCETCHSDAGWRVAVTFDHDITRFPLIGLHVLEPCESCHFDSGFVTSQTRCDDCHAKDDPHDRSLGTDCETCHNPNGWAYWSFDHNRQTRFALKGSHDGLQCRGCHTSPLQPEKQTVRACIDCHLRDDVHKGTFGKQCSFCHDETKFDHAKLK